MGRGDTVTESTCGGGRYWLYNRDLKFRSLVLQMPAGEARDSQLTGAPHCHDTKRCQRHHVCQSLGEHSRATRGEGKASIHLSEDTSWSHASSTYRHGQKPTP